jgi:hypothetical protein
MLVRKNKKKIDQQLQLLDLEPHLILEQVGAEVEVVLVLELEEQCDGGLVEDEHVEDDTDEVGDDALGLDDACTRSTYEG